MTISVNCVNVVEAISTHTLTWSVTVSVSHVYKAEKNFNSHAHVERDSDIMSNVDACMDFNSHAHVERDAVEKFPDTLKIEFQLTRSRGA